MKYPLTRIAIRNGATRFGVVSHFEHFSLDMNSEPRQHCLGMCEKEFVRGCERAVNVFRDDFVKRDIHAIAQYTTPNITTLVADQLRGNAPYIHDISHADAVVDVVDARIESGFVQRPEYSMGFLRARDFMDGVYGPEKFLIHPCEKRLALISFTATETYRIWERDEDGGRTGEALYDETDTTQYIVRLDHDMLGNVLGDADDTDDTVDENWVISGINGYD